MWHQLLHTGNISVEMWQMCQSNDASGQVFIFTTPPHHCLQVLDGSNGGTVNGTSRAKVPPANLRFLQNKNTFASFFPRCQFWCAVFSQELCRHLHYARHRQYPWHRHCGPKRNLRDLPWTKPLSIEVKFCWFKVQYPVSYVHQVTKTNYSESTYFLFLDQM